MSNQLIVALDTNELRHALELANSLASYCGMFKIGLELFCSAGNSAVREIACHRPIMLDLKLHDIPITVERTVKVLSLLTPAILTVHAAGGEKMIAAARRGRPTSMSP